MNRPATPLPPHGQSGHSSENRVEPADTVPLASFDVQAAAPHELVFVRMTPIEPHLAAGKRVYALNLGQAAALRDRLDDAISVLRRELRTAEHAR